MKKRGSDGLSEVASDLTENSLERFLVYPRLWTLFWASSYLIFTETDREGVTMSTDPMRLGHRVSQCPILFQGASLRIQSPLRVRWWEGGYGQENLRPAATASPGSLSGGKNLTPPRHTDSEHLLSSTQFSLKNTGLWHPSSTVQSPREDKK